jgi:MerR family transcriptional regulator/heat shock protein HspR
MKRGKGYFSISAVAKMFSVHQQTIRLYEKEGLITPKRTEGGTRMYSEEDIDKLEEIIYLTHRMGVNLAGVEMVMRLQKKIKRLQNEVNKLFTQEESILEEESTRYKDDIKKNVEALHVIHKKSIKALPDKSPKLNDEPDDIDPEGWDIDYDE